MTTDILRVTQALTQPVIPPKAQAAVDLVLTFRVEQPGKVQGKAPRLPLNLSVVIDRSGSMSGKPLQQAIAATEVLLGQLVPDDTLSVVTFDGKVTTVVRPQAVTKTAAIRKAVRTIRPGGSTNLHGGWVRGCKHVLASQPARQFRRVLLLTDGQATDGITDTKKLIAEARKLASSGVPTTTLGFGKGFNEDLLIGMAEASGGNFYFIETPGDASQVFQIEGESLTSVTVRNLTVTLTPARGVKIREILNRLPTTTKPTGVVVTGGDVYATEERIIAIEMNVPAQTRIKKNLPLLEVAYTYDPVLSRNNVTVIGEPVSGQFSVAVDVAKNASHANFDVLQQAARIRVAWVKEQAVKLADARNHTEAASALRGVVKRLREHELDEEYEIAEEVAQLKHFATALEKGEFGADDRKMLRDQAYQGRNRNRSDLNARGGAGGSARGLPTTDTATGGVEVRCVRKGGKFRVSVVTPGYKRDFRVLLPRGIREEGVHYVVDRLELSKNGTFYRPVGTLRRLTKPKTGAPAGSTT
jgi:Ca-activated chloride channel family protein